MKTYNLEEIKAFAKSNKNYIEDDDQQEASYSIEEVDKAKTRILKYIFYKKRTESEVRKKFSKEYNEDLIEEVINNLKENGYIDDENYIERSVAEFMAIRNLSIREIKYKLIAKGINTNEIENYIEKNKDQLLEYEVKSAQNIVQKKQNQMEKFEIKRYLMKKGYGDESIRESI